MPGSRACAWPWLDAGVGSLPWLQEREGEIEIEREIEMREREIEMRGGGCCGGGGRDLLTAWGP